MLWYAVHIMLAKMDKNRSLQCWLILPLLVYMKAMQAVITRCWKTYQNHPLDIFHGEFLNRLICFTFKIALEFLTWHLRLGFDKWMPVIRCWLFISGVLEVKPTLVPDAQAMRPSSFLIKMKVNRQENNLSPQGVFLVSVFMTSQVERKGPTVFFHIARSIA